MFISGPLSLVTRYIAYCIGLTKPLIFSNTTILSSSTSLFWDVLEENESK